MTPGEEGWALKEAAGRLKPEMLVTSGVLGGQGHPRAWSSSEDIEWAHSLAEKCRSQKMGCTELLKGSPDLGWPLPVSTRALSPSERPAACCLLPKPMAHVSAQTNLRRQDARASPLGDFSQWD